MKKLYIVTGCSKGIGKALVEKLLQDKESEIIGISRSPLKKSKNFRHIKLDLSKLKSLVKKLDQIFPQNEEYSEIVLINNAGIIGEIKPIGKLNNDSIAEVFSVNAIAPAILINAFIEKYSKTTATKLIINISSGAARNAYDGWSGYCSTKAALEMFALVGDKEAKLNKNGFKFFSVSPGVIDTQMQDTIRDTSKSDFSNVERFIELKENKQLLSPETVAERLTNLINNHQHYNEVVVDLR